MSRISKPDIDLESIHAVILGQRKVATTNMQNAAALCSQNVVLNKIDAAECWLKESQHQAIRVNCLTDLLLELEAAGVVWTDNIVELNHD